MKLSEEITKINCHLIARGTRKVNGRVLDDLAIPDPDLATGKKIIEKEIEEDVNSGNS